MDGEDSAPAIPRSVVTDDSFDWEGDAPLRRPWAETVIYELHVKGFTQRMPGVRDDLRGTYAGLASDAAVGHLRDLGITAVELLPVHHIADEDFLVERGLTNYWGYSTIGFLSPHAGYAATGTRGEQVREFKGMVKALHRAGIEVILDVVYNHTAEGSHLGPTLSLQGCRQRVVLPPPAGRPAPLHGLHRDRQLAQPGASVGAAPDHGLAPLLRGRVPCRRLPVRPRLGARAGAVRRRPPLGVLRRHPPGSGAQPGEADRRAVGRRPRRLPGRELPDPLVRVERDVPGHDARLLARAHGRRRVRAPVHGLERPLPVGRAASLRVDQLRHLPRRVHAPRPRLVRPQAQRGQPRGQSRRHGRQPLLELRRRGRDRRSGGQRAARPADPQLPRDPAPLAGNADAPRRRRDPADAAGQQQRLLPGQRAFVGRLGARRARARPPRVHPAAAATPRRASRVSAVGVSHRRGAPRLRARRTSGGSAPTGGG